MKEFAPYVRKKFITQLNIAETTVEKIKDLVEHVHQ